MRKALLLLIILCLTSACSLPSHNPYGSSPLDWTDGVVSDHEAISHPIVADYPGVRGLGHEQDMVVGEAHIISAEPLKAQLIQYDGFGDGDEYTKCVDDACNVRVPIIEEMRTMDETYEVGDMVCVRVRSFDEMPRGYGCEFYPAHWFVVVAG